jgi:predicted dehydrogenase
MFRTALEIAGDAGLIEYPGGSSMPLGIHLRQSGTSAPDIAVPSSPLTEDPYTTQIKHFYAVLAQDTPPRVTAEDGLRALEIALAASQSAQSGQPVTVQEVA